MNEKPLKRALTPAEMLEIAARHMFCAEHLLQNEAELSLENSERVDTLLPVVSLLYPGFEMLFKARLLHEQGVIRHVGTLHELLSQHEWALQREDREHIEKLARMRAFRKGIEIDLHDSREKALAFCMQLLEVYERLQKLLPLEMQLEYQQ